MGEPAAPGNPDTKTNQYHFDSLERGLGMDDEGMDAALTGGSITIWQVPNYFNKWGFLVSGPVDVSIRKSPDGNYQCTYQLKAKQQMEPLSFYLPYKKGERPTYYKGKVEDKTEIIGVNELQDLMSKPFQNMPAGGAMGGGMPGGAPPMGGGMAGAPPMGAPPMGGPPAGAPGAI
jgi:hypothetical protein